MRLSYAEGNGQCSDRECLVLQQQRECVRERAPNKPQVNSASQAVSISPASNSEAAWFAEANPKPSMIPAPRPIAWLICR